jgi:hypothetical protein
MTKTDPNFKNLYEEITKIANEISVMTRRNGNYIILNQVVLEIFKFADMHHDETRSMF